MHRPGRVAEPGAERTHQRGGVQALPGGQARATQPSGRIRNASTSTWSVRAVTVLTPSGPPGRGVADLRAVDEVQQKPTPVTQQVRRSGHRSDDVGPGPLQGQLHVPAQGADKPDSGDASTSSPASATST